MVSFPQASPPTPCAHLSPLPYAPHAQPISFFLILPILGKEYRSLSLEGGICGGKQTHTQNFHIRNFYLIWIKNDIFY
jgi:hypothetical protein